MAHLVRCARHGIVGIYPSYDRALKAAHRHEALEDDGMAMCVIMGSEPPENINRGVSFFHKHGYSGYMTHLGVGRYPDILELTYGEGGEKVFPNDINSFRLHKEASVSLFGSRNFKDQIQSEFKTDQEWFEGPVKSIIVH